MLAAFSGCIKDTLITTYTYTLASPIFKTTQEVRANIKNLPGTALKNPGKMYVSGSYIFLNERNKGIHVINNSNPANPVNESFIAIPGCEDLAIYDKTLYADCYTDLMVLDISNPKSVILKEVNANLFPERRYTMGFAMDSNQVITDWIVRDTIVKYKTNITDGQLSNGGLWFNSFDAFVSLSSGNSVRAQAGKGGSMARFAITHDYLYAVTQQNLLALSLANPNSPKLTSNKAMGWGIETIYPFQDKLFIGSNSGMFIYLLTNPAQPKQTAVFTHATVCDPVIADGNFAYVTLRSGVVCQGFTNQLDVVNIENIYNPKLVRSYPLTNPHGLDKRGNWLFVCDGKDGLKVLDATDAANLKLKKTIAIKDTYDVICWGPVAIVSTAAGIYQYDIQDVEKISLLSKIMVTP
jgi:hypothetical protein